MVLGMTLSGYKVRGCPGSILGCGLKKEKSMHNIYVYISYMHIIYIYIAYICKVKSVRYINRTSFTTYMG